MIKSYENFMLKENKNDVDPFSEEIWGDNIQNLPQIGGFEIANNHQIDDDDEIPPMNSFKIIVGRTPRNWGSDARISALVVNLVDSINGDAGWVFDGELSYNYPILNQIDNFDEIAEGTFEYYGNLTVEEIVNRLIEFGFIAEAGNLNQRFPIPI